MPPFTVRASHNLTLTSYSGLALLGQCFQAAQVDIIVDSKIPVSQGMRTSDLVKSAVGILALGKPDFQAIDAHRQDRFFKQSLNLCKVPSPEWLRQRLDLKAADIRSVVDELSVRLIERTDAPITPNHGFVCFDTDTFATDNSKTKKEFIGRTYQGFDGYTVMAGYLGNEGWNVGLELRHGSQHSACETDYFYERVFPRVHRLVKPDMPVLMREDSGFDSAKLLFAKHQECQRYLQEGRSFNFITKWNPRKQDINAWMAQAPSWTSPREGKRVAVWSQDIQRAWKGKNQSFRLVVRIVERTIDKHGQALLIPDIRLEGWWTSLASQSDEEIIKLYEKHGEHEQFHSEFKTDLDMERLPSGKFDTNDAWLGMSGFAYNCLRLLGQLGLTGELSPVRHPAKRRRIRTVLQEIMCVAAKVVHHSKQWALDFGGTMARYARLFAGLQTRLQSYASG